jgi:hypothetical protein
LLRDANARNIQLESTTAKKMLPASINLATFEAYIALADAKTASPEQNMPFLQAITWVARTFKERRRSLREDAGYSAWIDIGDGTPPRLCAVLDVSEDGARILLASAVALPQEFSLVFTKYGTIRRRCRLVWHSGVELGVNYLGPLECEDPSTPDRGAFKAH